MYGRLRPGAMINYLIQSSIASADKIGLGFSGLKNQSLFWVLSRLSLKINYPLKWYDKISVETWPKDVDKIIYLRDFIITDKKQHVAAIATSGWLAIDSEKKRPKKIEGVHAGIFDHFKDKHAIRETPVKLGKSTGGEIREIIPAYSDYDINKHVTATRYVDWAMDTLSCEFHETMYPAEIDINFLRETLPGENINLIKTLLGENTYLFHVTNMVSGLDGVKIRVCFVNI